MLSLGLPRRNGRGRGVCIDRGRTSENPCQPKKSGNEGRKQVLSPIDQHLIRADGSEPIQDAGAVQWPGLRAGFDEGHILFRQPVQLRYNDSSMLGQTTTAVRP